MSLPIQRPKAFFYFYSPLQTIFDSPRVSDTTAVSRSASGRTNFKTYSLTLPPGANMIRVLVYGYISAGSGAIWLNIDDRDVVSVTVSNTTEALLIDYIASISPGAHTIKVDGNPAGNTLYVTKVFIATGIGLTTTTTSVIATASLIYQLLRQGDIRYSPGVRMFVFGNRKTTAPTTITVSEATSITVGRNNLGAGNDNDKSETILAILTGSVALQEGGEFTIPVTLSGNVGASGDTVIVTRILARAQLRRESFHVGVVRVYEGGVASYAGRALLVSVPGGVSSTNHLFSQRDVNDSIVLWIAISVGGSDISIQNFNIPVVTAIHFRADYDVDVYGEAFLVWVQVVVWG